MTYDKFIFYFQDEKILTAKEIEFLLLQPSFLAYCVSIHLKNNNLKCIAPCTHLLRHNFSFIWKDHIQIGPRPNCSFLFHFQATETVAFIILFLMYYRFNYENVLVVLLMTSLLGK